LTAAIGSCTRSVVTNSLLHNDPGEYVGGDGSISGVSLKEPSRKSTPRDGAHGGSGGEGAPSISEEVGVCLARPLFVWSMLGYGAYAGGILGFSTFGPQFVMGLGYFNEEYAVSYEAHAHTRFCIGQRKGATDGSGAFESPHCIWRVAPRHLWCSARRWRLRGSRGRPSAARCSTTR